MSRHRNVRSMNYKDEYDGYDDVYGHSVEDDSCISPSDAAQWLYDRARGTQHGIGSYLDTNKDIPEEDEDASDDIPRRDSIDLPELSSLDKARLASCLEGIRNVIGDTIPELILAETVIKHDFDLTTSLNAVLSNTQDAETRKHSIDTDLKSNNETKKPLSLKDLMNSSSRNSNFNNRFSIRSNLMDKPDSSKPDPKPQSAKFGSLAELTSFHLNNTNLPSSGNKFVIPKFQMNLQSKLKDDNNMSSQKSTELENWHIDLTSALKTVSSDTSVKSKTQNMDVEDFVPQFVDCEMDTGNALVVDPLSECCMNISHILNADFTSLNKHCTQFGRILCRTYHHNYLPDIRHSFDILQNLEQFKFDVPSPDDMIEKFVRK